MSNKGRQRTDQAEVLRLVQEILFRDWDPIGVNWNELLNDEYSSYAPTISRYLREGVDEYKLVAHLGQLQRLSMGLSSIDEDRDHRVARKLLALLHDDKD